jgi:NitT/TauT family transport system substrate-binding protein
MKPTSGALRLLVLCAWLAIGCTAPPAPSAREAATSGPASPMGSGTTSTAEAPASAVGPRPIDLAPLPQPAKVRLGWARSLADGPVFVAIDRGYFTELGLDVEDIRFDSATGMMQPLAAGQLDVVTAAISAGLFNAFARDIDVRIVADRGIHRAGHAPQGLVVRQDLWESESIRTLADLPGRKVGIPGFNAGSQMTRVLGKALEERGQSLTALDITDLATPEINVALANRSLDAAMQIEPLLTLGAASGVFTQALRSDELYPDQQAGFALYAADFARNQAEAGRRWMIGYLRGARAYNDAFLRDQNFDDVVESLVRYTAVKDRALYRQMATTYAAPDGRMNVAAVVEDQDWYADRGYVSQKVDINALIDYQFVDYALSVLPAVP